MARRSGRGERPSHLKRGQAAKEAWQDARKEEQRRQEERDNRGPRRFRCFKPKGSSVYDVHEVVVLDEDFDDPIQAYEHSVDGPGGDYTRRQHVMCIDEFGNCPICRASEQNIDDRFKPPMYNMYCTVLDMNPYTIQKGPNAGQVRESTRSLMVIPMALMDTYKKIAALCKKEHGTTRGMVMLLTKKKKNDARCGEPQMMDNGMLFDFMTEDELQDWAEDEVKRNDGTVLFEEGENIEPYDYDEILGLKTEEEIARMFGLEAPEGSDAADETSGRRRRRRRAAADEPDTDAEDEAPKSRRRRRAAKDEDEDEPPRRSRRSRRAQVEDDRDDEGDDDGYDDDDGDEEPPRRTRRRRTAPEEDADDGDQDDDHDDDGPDDEADEEDEAPRRSRRSRRRTADEDEAPAPSRRRRRRSSKDFPDDE